jgi:hypothetical protein
MGVMACTGDSSGRFFPEEAESGRITKDAFFMTKKQLAKNQ